MILGRTYAQPGGGIREGEELKDDAALVSITIEATPSRIARAGVVVATEDMNEVLALVVLLLPDATHFHHSHITRTLTNGLADVLNRASSIQKASASIKGLTVTVVRP